MANKKRLALVMNHILDNPHTWDQLMWHCGTSHCFGGWAQKFACKAEDADTARADAQEWLELTVEQAHRLFDTSISLPDLWLEVMQLCYPDQLPISQPVSEIKQAIAMALPRIQVDDDEARG